jgi:aminopeptidase N
LVRVKRVELDVIGERTFVPGLVGEAQPDLVLVNDDDLTYAKVRLDEKSLRTLIEGIDTFEEPLPRAICWTAAWDMTRDAEMRMRDFTELALGGVAGESDISVVQTVLGQIVAGLQSFADPESREKQLTNAAERLGQLLRNADAGSDHQLGFARFFATLARTPQQLDLLGQLLDGGTQLDGLQVDTELRWSFLRRLVATGQRGTDAIDAELERDHTAAGQRHAAAARAMVPTADAKTKAWRLAVESDELPNAVLSATVAGYAIPDHRELHRAHVQRYFEVIEDVWSMRTNETAQTIVIGMYPASLNEQSTVDLTDDYLATRQPTPALRRLLVEGRDSVLRALRAQVRDASAH